MIALTATACGALILGFATGMATYRASRRWCQTCGTSLTCPQCTRRDARLRV